MNLHIPVLLDACIEGLNIRPDGIYVDGTLGRAGHAAEIVKRLDTGLLIGIDRDEAAITAGRDKLVPFGDRILFVHGNFREIHDILTDLNIPEVDGMLFDLGVSSPQLDDAERGFSYMEDAPLDMRMDQRAALTAWEVVNTWPEDELRSLLYTYGEERYARGIARSIVTRRESAPIKTTHELVEIIKQGMPPVALREKQHPAKRTFQAIRIAVNDELEAIRSLMDAAVPHLKQGGRLAVISFHSLEDRIVKTAIASREKGCTCPPDFPVCVCGFKQTLKAINKKPIVPSTEETERNPRARSAKLRIAERI